MAQKTGALIFDETADRYLQIFFVTKCYLPTLIAERRCA